LEGKCLLHSIVYDETAKAGGFVPSPPAFAFT